MSFLTEDPDTLRDIANDNLREALQGIRVRKDFKKYQDPFGTTYQERTQPHIFDITDRDPWAERYDHPKD